MVTCQRNFHYFKLFRLSTNLPFHHSKLADIQAELAHGFVIGQSDENRQAEAEEDVDIDEVRSQLEQAADIGEQADILHFLHMSRCKVFVFVLVKKLNNSTKVPQSCNLGSFHSPSLGIKRDTNLVG